MKRVLTLAACVTALVVVLSMAVLVWVQKKPARDADITRKLERLYGPYLTTKRHSGYRDVLETLREISIEDPLASDLLKDACTYVAQRTFLIEQGMVMQGWHDKTRRVVLRSIANATPEEQAKALQRFESEPTQMDNLKQTDAALARVFAARFKRRHNLDPELVIQRLNTLTLPNVGLELWLRCNENVSPFKPRNPPRFAPEPQIVPHENPEEWMRKEYGIQPPAKQ